MRLFRAVAWVSVCVAGAAMMVGGPVVSAAPPPASTARCPPDMVFVPAGTPVLGGTYDLPPSIPSNPSHAARLDAFCIDRVEVTVGEFTGCANCQMFRGRAQPASYCPSPPSNDYPVVCVTPAEATSYCQVNGKRLPSADEWEYAARGTDGRLFPWGNAFPHRDASWTIGSYYESSSASGDISPFGAIDMASNVGEWTTEVFPSMSAKPPAIYRGGGGFWRAEPRRRSVVLKQTSFTTYDPAVGFRCVRTL